jgi:hypothetical protein
LPHSGSPPSLLIGFTLFAFVLILPIAVLRLLRRERQRWLGEIQSAAAERSWQFSVQRGWGNATAFSIHGETFGALPWSLQTGETSGEDWGWSLRVELTFPTLGGDCDLAVVPRKGRRSAPIVALQSGESREFPSGLTAFDARYEVLASARQVSAAPLDEAIAERFLKWPKNTVQPHVMLAWRDQSGCHVEAHLPAMPNWSTIQYLVFLGEDFCARLPAPVFSRAAKSAAANRAI